MNFNIGASSYISLSSSSSSSSSSDDDALAMNTVAQLDEEEEIMMVALKNNNMTISHCIGELNTPINHGGSVHGHVVIDRDREMGDHSLFMDYFSPNQRYGEALFRRRYRMSRDLFLQIVGAVTNHDNYFHQRRNATGRLGLSALQKLTAVFRMLAYGVPADATDEYVKIGESTAIESMKRFCRSIVQIYGGQYLRRPNDNDIARLLDIGKQRGFPGMLGSLDCMHWKWKNCPTAWAGQYSGRSGSPTIILEAVADYDLWIWHAYFGMPGSNNDINVLEASNLFSDLAQGIAPPAHYIIQGKEYNVGYYLADGIYPKWSTLVQTIHQPQGRKKKYFAMRQEACRKDVERAFGVLQSRFAIIAGPSRFWEKKVLHDIMSACIIMHNMIIENERDIHAPVEDVRDTPVPDIEVAVDEAARFTQFLSRHNQIHDKDAHIELRNALIEHLWEQFSNSDN
ncbi:unnamed protein product [Cuscuta epithymum]|uniref:Nuclease HARBI1 n=1 Tax=Cuscuta epithymum TaxID=186058 RepID=A0AAV0EUH3_9ASTE|nr:unnamed protein product [Cuscuta epithymum]